VSRDQRSRGFVTRTYEVASPKVGRDLTLAFLADQHNVSYGTRNEPVLEELGRVAPDAVMVGGDLVVAARADNRSDAWKRPMVELMRDVAARWPVYYVNGNHEELLRALPAFARSRRFDGTYDGLMRDLEACGVRHLSNRGELLGEGSGVRVWGLELPVCYYGRHRVREVPEGLLREMLGPADPGAFNLLLTHNPLWFASYAAWGADLTLAGHVHGGVVRLGSRGLINPEHQILPPYTGGRYELAGSGGTSVMVVTCGMGTHSVAVRVNNPAELSVVRLRPVAGADAGGRAGGGVDVGGGAIGEGAGGRAQAPQHGDDANPRAQAFWGDER